MTQLTFVTGLPGSGKSHYTGILAQQTGAEFIDDYKKHSLDGSLAFQRSRNYERLIALLSEGRDCIVNDIDFYEPSSRQEAIDALVSQFRTELDIKWVFFEKNIEACVQNVCHRALQTGRGLHSLGGLFAYAVIGNVPDNVEVLSVWSEQRSLIPRQAFPNEEILEVIHSLHWGLLHSKNRKDIHQLKWAEGADVLQKVLYSFLAQFESD